MSIIALYLALGAMLAAAWLWLEVLIRPRPTLIFRFLNILLGWPLYAAIGIGLLAIAAVIDPERANKILAPGHRAMP